MPRPCLCRGFARPLPCMNDFAMPLPCLYRAFPMPARGWRRAARPTARSRRAACRRSVARRGCGSSSSSSSSSSSRVRGPCCIGGAAGSSIDGLQGSGDDAAAWVRGLCCIGWATGSSIGGFQGGAAGLGGVEDEEAAAAGSEAPAASQGPLQQEEARRPEGLNPSILHMEAAVVHPDWVRLTNLRHAMLWKHDLPDTAYLPWCRCQEVRAGSRSRGMWRSRRSCTSAALAQMLSSAR